jgi:hypothetical protein
VRLEHPMLRRLGEIVKELDPGRRYIPTSRDRAIAETMPSVRACIGMCTVRTPDLDSGRG